MGNPAFGDVAAPAFWAFAASAIVLLAVMAHTAWYRPLLAGVNLAFCVVLVGPLAAGALALALAALHGVGRLSSTAARATGIAAAGLLLAAAFVLHKLPAGAAAPASAIKAVLAALGLSYIALRIVEYLRAAWQEPPDDLTLPDTINYLVPFHMLAAGPIASFAEFVRHRAPGPLGGDDVFEAIERIARGLFKKFVLAEGLIQTVFLTDFKAGGAYFFLEVQMYYLFIYLDFSAYTDIAIGIGRLLGVRTPENFHRPLAARNIVQFWERWHISLSMFIRRNVFIPVQLAAMRGHPARNPLAVAAAAYLVAFVACGLWHGLSWRFLLWGLGHALALIVCNLYRHWLLRRLGAKGMSAYLQRPFVRAAATLLTFEFVAFSLAFIAHPATAFLG